MLFFLTKCEQTVFDQELTSNPVVTQSATENCSHKYKCTWSTHTLLQEGQKGKEMVQLNNRAEKNEGRLSLCMPTGILLRYYDGGFFFGSFW